MRSAVGTYYPSKMVRGTIYSLSVTEKNSKVQPWNNSTQYIFMAVVF